MKNYKPTALQTVFWGKFSSPTFSKKRNASPRALASLHSLNHSGDERAEFLCDSVGGLLNLLM